MHSGNIAPKENGAWPAIDRAAVAARRSLLFRETPFETMERWLLGSAWALMPDRIGGLPGLARLWLLDLAARSPAIPDPNSIVDEASGLCGIAHDLSPQTLTAAYRAGLFPGGHLPPVKWFSPGWRCVLRFDEFHLGKTARRLARIGRFRVTFDRDFEGVIKACAGRRRGKWHLTWITPKIMRAYADLFDAGHAHSFEVWNRDNALVGGGYGVAVDGMFHTESLFSAESDASKVGFAVLNWHLAKWGYRLNDVKWENPLLVSMGCRAIARTQFHAALANAATVTGNPGRWREEADAGFVSGWRPESLAASSGRRPASGGLGQEAGHSSIVIPFLPILDTATSGHGMTLLTLL